MERGKRSQPSFCQHNSISLSHLRDSPLSVYNPPSPLYPLLSLKVNAVSANHLQLIDPAHMRALVSTALAVIYWLIEVTAACIDKDLPLRPPLAVGHWALIRPERQIKQRKAEIAARHRVLLGVLFVPVV